MKSEINARLILCKRSQKKRAFTRVNIRNFHSDRDKVIQGNAHLVVNGKLKLTYEICARDDNVRQL